MFGGFRKGWLILLLVVAIQVASAIFSEDRDQLTPRRPPLAPPLVERSKPVRPGPALPPPSARDPLMTIETGEKTNSTGTAFAIRDDGVWLTALHVVYGCDKVGLVIAPHRAVQVSRISQHPRADMAVLWTRTKAPALAISPAALHVQQEGFHFGFPQGEPGEVSSLLLGRLNMRSVGRYRHTEPVVAWAERRRVPETETLGGISGGPALNAKGEIVGVTVAASKRRGRVMTTAPVSLQEMLSIAHVRPDGIPSAGLNTGPYDGNFVNYGDALRGQLTVAQVICRVDGETRPPRRRR